MSRFESAKERGEIGCDGRKRVRFEGEEKTLARVVELVWLKVMWRIVRFDPD